ncbi:MAG: hypothetical protein IPK17_38970 [Chloroflexi bacterium]|nr:hypothetical protein [Chloroflexota bacterium]
MTKRPDIRIRARRLAQRVINARSGTTPTAITAASSVRGPPSPSAT